MQMEIYNLQTINILLQELQEVVEVEFTEHDLIDKIIERGSLINSKLGISTKLLADAKYRRNEFLESAVMQTLKKQASEVMYAEVQKKYILGISREYEYMVDWADRINAKLTHDLDWMRSLLSAEKTIQYAYRVSGQLTPGA